MNSLFKIAVVFAFAAVASGNLPGRYQPSPQSAVSAHSGIEGIHLAEGYADVKTTERYAHLSADHLAGVRDIIKPNIGINGKVIQGWKNPTEISEVSYEKDQQFAALS